MKISLLVLPVWVIIYFIWLEDSLYGQYFIDIPYPVYDALSGNCVEHCQLSDETRDANVPLWSVALNKFTEWSIFLTLAGTFRLVKRMAGDYQEIRLRKQLPLRFLYVVVVLLAHYKALVVAINS